MARPPTTPRPADDGSKNGKPTDECDRESDANDKNHGEHHDNPRRNDAAVVADPPSPDAHGRPLLSRSPRRLGCPAAQALVVCRRLPTLSSPRVQVRVRV